MPKAPLWIWLATHDWIEAAVTGLAGGPLGRSIVPPYVIAPTPYSDVVVDQYVEVANDWANAWSCASYG